MRSTAAANFEQLHFGYEFLRALQSKQDVSQIGTANLSVERQDCVGGLEINCLM